MTKCGANCKCGEPISWEGAYRKLALRPCFNCGIANVRAFPFEAIENEDSAMGVIKNIDEKEAFPDQCRVLVHDRYRFGSRDVTGTVSQHAGANDGVRVDIDAEYHFLLALDKKGFVWVRPQQLVRIQDKKFPEDDERMVVVQEPDTALNIGDVWKGLNEGRRYARAGWNGRGMYIEKQTPDEHSKMTQPYNYMVCPPGSTRQYGENHEKRELIPWLCSQGDFYALDWVEVTDI